ncbi:MAG TPA: ROK family protein [Bryobacteraceae bacterium]|nr:ROK family protein [Bryobacteraceae bacterium]
MLDDLTARDTAESTLCGAIEAGGTKVVCAIGTGPHNLRREVFPTTLPAETLARMLEFFSDSGIVALGVASFGPLDLDRLSPGYGRITSTPKPGWKNTDLVGPLRRALGVPIAFDTDVNAAAVGEVKWGAAKGLRDVLYITVGTGVGGGALVNGEPVHGLIHPEMGHIRVPRNPAEDGFPGVCPYHGDCIEGLVSGPAIARRVGRPADSLPDDHEVWQLVARYLALAIVNWMLTLSPQRVILGGGVMSRLSLFPKVRQHVSNLLNQYVQTPAVVEHMDTYIVPPGLENDAGVLGALALAQELTPAP